MNNLAKRMGLKKFNKDMEFDKMNAGVFTQIKKSRKVVKIEKIDAELKSKLLDNKQTTDAKFIEEIAKRLKESNKLLLEKLIRHIGRQQTLAQYS